MSDWQGFFVAAGIPTGIASRYANSFSENRITRTMLPDLDKTTLTELGIKAIGDQLAILRRVKESGNALKQESPVVCVKETGRRVRISPPSEDASTSIVIPGASEARKGRPPPDRHEIYHIKMPSGVTAKTKQMLQTAQELKVAGVLKRGMSGVRQGGRPVSPISKDATARRLAMHNRMYEVEEVSSSTDTLINRLGVQGMHSDRLEIRKVAGGRVIKKSVPSPLFSRALDSATSPETPQPRIRVRLPSSSLSTVHKKSVAHSSSASSSSILPRITLNLRTSEPPSSRNQTQKRGAIANRLTGANVQFNRNDQRKGGLKGRVGGLTMGRQQVQQVVYEDELEDEMEYEDEEIFEYVEDDDDQYEDERPSIYERLGR